MAKYQFKANSFFESMTQDEMQESLSTSQKNWFQEMARGLKHFRIQPSSVAISAGAATLPNPAFPIGPRDGFIWEVTRISVVGLSGSDVAKIYINTVNDMNFVNQVSAGSPTAIFGEKSFVLHPGDTIIITGSSLSATGNLTVTGEAVEVAAIDIWKILQG